MKQVHIDSQRDLPFSPVSGMNYLQGHNMLVTKFMNERIRKVDQPSILCEFMQDPMWLANLIDINYESGELQRINTVLELATGEGMFTIIFGSKGGGKTSAVFWVIERLLERDFQQKHTLYWFGYNPEISRQYPMVKQTMNLEQCENGLVIIDEAAVQFLGRDAMSREVKNRVRLFFTSRHKNVSIFFLTQTPRIDPIILELHDNIWFKPYSAIRGSMLASERSIMVKPQLKYILPVKKWENMFYNSNTAKTYVFRNELPKKWNDELSKPFSKIKTEKQAHEFIDILFDAGMTQKEVEMYLRQRGWKYEEVE